MSDTVNSKNKRQSAHNSAYYKVQFGRTDDNKRKKLARHLKRFPEDGQAKKLFGEKFLLKYLPATVTARAHRRAIRAESEARTGRRRIARELRRAARRELKSRTN